MTPGVVGIVYDGVVEAPFTQLDCVTVGATALTSVGGMTAGALRTVALLFGVTLTAPGLDSVAVKVSTVDAPAAGDDAGTVKVHRNESWAPPEASSVAGTGPVQAGVMVVPSPPGPGP